LVRIEKSIEIKARPEKVWEMLAFDRQLEWMEGYKSVEYTSEVSTPKDKYRVGASAHAIVKHFGKFDIEITESLENEKIMYRVQGIEGVRNLNGTFTLKPTEAGTKMTFLQSYEPSSLVAKMFSLGAGRWFEKSGEKSLEKLKNILEK